MKQLLFIVIPLLFVGCQSNDSANYLPTFNQSDSTAIVKTILDSMQVEFNNQWFMTEEKFQSTCSMPPSFSPSVSIKINGKELILCSGQFSPKSISDSILQFYSINIVKNDLTSNAPLYNWLSKKEILEHIVMIEDEIIRMETLRDYSKDILEYRKDELIEWEGKLKILNTLKVDKIPQPEYDTGITLDYPKDCKINGQLMDTIFIGFYKVRELDAQHYFKESYAKLFWKATTQSDTLSMDKIDAIKMLHPINLIDFPKCKSCLYSIPPPLPPN